MRIYLTEKLFIAEDGNLFSAGLLFNTPAPIDFNQLALRQLKQLEKVLKKNTELLSLSQAERYAEIKNLVTDIERLTNGGAGQ